MTTTEDKLRQGRRRRLAVLFLFALFFVSFGGYILLGGFKQPVLSEVKIPGYMIAGREFQGESNDQELGRIFDQAKELHQNGQLPGTLAALYYHVKDADKGKVHTFAGVIVRDSSLALPKDFTYRTIPAGKGVRAEIFAHFLVAPAPGKVQQNLADFARKNGLTPANYVIEKYYDSKNIVLEIPVKESQ